MTDKETNATSFVIFGLLGLVAYLIPWIGKWILWGLAFIGLISIRNKKEK